MAATLSPTDSPTWYIATNSRGRVLTNRQPFVRVKEVGQRLISPHPNGFVVFADPIDIRYVRRACDQAPWQLWQVALPGVTGSGSDLFKWRSPSVRVVQQMPAGFEFGQFGPRVQDLIAHVGSLRHWPEDRLLLYTELSVEDAAAIEEIHYRAPMLAVTHIRAYLYQRGVDWWSMQRELLRKHGPELDDLARLAMAGRALPQVSVSRWSIPDHLAAAATPLPVDVP